MAISRLSSGAYPQASGPIPAKPSASAVSATMLYTATVAPKPSIVTSSFLYVPTITSKASVVSASFIYTTVLAFPTTISIDGEDVPDTMATRGLYDFQAQRVKIIAGSRRAARAGQQMLSWKFQWMEQAEYDWWCDTALAGAESKVVTATLRDNYHRFFRVSSAILHKPVYRLMTGGLYYDVVIEMHHIIPLRFATS